MPCSPIPAQSRSNQISLLRSMSSWVLNSVKDGDSTTSLDDLFHYLTILMVKKRKKKKRKFPNI